MAQAKTWPGCHLQVANATGARVSHQLHALFTLLLQKDIGKSYQFYEVEYSSYQNLGLARKRERMAREGIEHGSRRRRGVEEGGNSSYASRTRNEGA